MLFLDAAFRFSAIALLLLLAIFAIREIRTSRSYLFLGLASASVAGLFLGYTPDAFDLPPPLKIIVRFLDIPHLIFIWLFALSLFLKDFTIGLKHWLIGAVYCLPIAVARIFQFTALGVFPMWATIAVGVMSFAIACHIMAVALLGHADDLSHRRRNSRVAFAVMIAFVTVSAAAIEVILSGELSIWLPTAKVMTIWPGVVMTALWVLRVNPDVFGFDGKVKTTAISEKRSKLHDALLTEMTTQKAYLDANLTIAELAKQLAVTQHTLRDHINQDLGFRNFSDFTNSYRIEAVKESLADPGNSDKSILEIALTHGFNSLSPFNRAFKGQLGVTPREYRESCKDKAHCE